VSFSLRPYQVDIVEDVARRIAAGDKRIVLVAPTGSGKTVIACEIIRRVTQQYKTALVLAHRREIITHTSRKLHAEGISHGIIAAGFSPRPTERVQVASVQTLWVRGVRSEAMQLPPADLLIVDECHHAPATTYTKIIDPIPKPRSSA
jgi:DNA repair protein RadD